MKILLILLISQCCGCFAISKLNISNNTIKVLCEKKIIYKDVDTISVCYADSLYLVKNKMDKSIYDKIILKSCEIEHDGVIVDLKNISKKPPNYLIVEYNVRSRYSGIENFGTITFEERENELIFISIYNITAIE